MSQLLISKIISFAVYSSQNSESWLLIYKILYNQQSKSGFAET